MKLKIITNPITHEKIEKKAHPKVREKFFLQLYEKFPSKSMEELEFLAEIEAQKTGKLNPLIERGLKLEELRRKFSEDENGK